MERVVRKRRSQHHWKCSNNVWMQHLGTWVRDGLDDFRGFFQPKQFYNPLIFTSQDCSSSVPTALPVQAPPPPRPRPGSGYPTSLSGGTRKTRN